MRVTKLIREYVENAVNKAYPDPDSLLILNEAQHRTNDAVTELNEKVNDYIMSILPEIQAKHNVPDDFKMKPRRNFNYVEWSDWNTPLREKASEDQRKLAEEKRKKKDEILLSLELGATRAELDKMIKNLLTK